MAIETVKDYLGHPCEIAKARVDFGESLQRAQRLEPRALAREIGIQLNKINARMEHTGLAIGVACEALQHAGDDAPTRSVLTMVKAYDGDTCNMFFVLAGHVLAMLERANLAATCEKMPTT